MTTPQIIFNAIRDVNNTEFYATRSSVRQIIADERREEVAQFVPAGTLAHKIINETQVKLTDKQLWVIAFELEKSAPEFVAAAVAAFEAREAEKKAEEAARKAKLAANKEAAADVLAAVKAAGRKLADYYSFLKGSKAFAREFYSKKYTAESVAAFLQA